MGKLDKFKKSGSTNLSKDSRERMEVVLTGQLPEDKDKVVPVEITKIRPNPNNDYNRYDDEESIKTLADDIERNGLLHNLVVSKRSGDEYVLISGERRYRALKILHEKQAVGGGDAGKYRFVPCRVVEGLSERAEMIMLDAANLQTRGGAGNEVMARKSAVRYRDNVKAEYGLSEARARALLEEISSLSMASISQNIMIQTELNKELVKYLDEGVIKKFHARRFLKLSGSRQEQVARTIGKILSDFEKDSDRYTAVLRKAVADFADAADEVTPKKAEAAIENVCRYVDSRIKREKEEKNREKSVDIKIREIKNTRKKERAESQRDFYLSKCDKAIKVMEELSKEKTLDRIRKFDSACEEENMKIVNRIDRLIALATKLKRELGGN